ncbi:MAG: DUF3846 domain-containing protein [Lachnospiraceae bacterium]|nr:DUF3846 domain-containing protein [Lachnospiraceae bacterium]
MKEAKVLRANGTEEVIVPVNGTDFSLEEAQKVVGGLIEIVNVADGMIIVCNEEGLFMDLDVNEKATCICLNSNAIRIGSAIVGDVLYCPTEMIK